jgi:carbamoyltransferase
VGWSVIVLGVNGWIDKTHDPAAALVVDGEVVAFAEEERFTRSKHGVGQLPHGAVASVLAESGIEPSEVDAVACGWDRQKFDSLRGISAAIGDVAAIITGRPELRRLPMHWIAHHDAHAASSFYGSGFDKATVVVADAEGEDESISIYLGDQHGLHVLRRFGRDVSLGLMYRAVSEYCGFGQFGAGQTMGLASYALPRAEPLPIDWVEGELRSPFDSNAWEDEVIQGWLAELEHRFGAPARPAPREAGDFPPLESHRPLAAAAAQLTVNLVMIQLVEAAVRSTGSRDVCLAGGVALNCVANGLLLDQVERLHVPPYPHDAGVALGAAQVISAQAGVTSWSAARADLGSPAIETIAGLASVPHITLADPAKAAADRILDGQVIGWMQGNMEVGPRALGRRSILALPNSASLRDRVNRLKGREPWRPVAPSVLAEQSAWLFGQDLDAPFMLLSVPMSAAGVQAMPGACHVDGTARLQTVTRADGLYRGLLEEIAAQSGTGAVLNTSFNGRGEPIVRTASEAVASARQMKLDAIIVEDRLIELGGDT